MIVAAFAASGVLAVCQTAVLYSRNLAFGNVQLLVLLGRVATIVAVVTLLLLMPVALLLRRRHAAWRSGDPLRASWSVCFGLAAALAGWMVGIFLTSGPLLPRWVQPWTAAGLGLAVGYVASRLQPPTRWIRNAAVLATLVLILCFVPIPATGTRTSSPQPGPPSPVRIAPGSKRPDVVLVSIDTLRADHLGVYGRSPSVTREMDRVAEEGVVFTRGLAASPWTNPSVASLLTGLPVTRHGAGLPLGSGLTFMRSPLDERFTTLAERFAAAGYRTRAVVANGFLSSESGMAQGFGEFVNPFASAMIATIMRDLPLPRVLVNLVPPQKWGDYRAQGVTDRAVRWLVDGDDTPLFLWVHYIDPHTPYQADPARLDLAGLGEMVHQTYPPVREDGTVVGEIFASTDLVRSGMLWLGPRDRQRLQEYYVREVQYTDTHVGRLFQALRTRSARRPVIAALTADHGEEFWDHGHFEHGHDYYREVTWVPIIFWGPGIVPARRTESAIAGLVDVGPTLVELAGLRAVTPESLDEGRSLAGLWGSASGKDLPVALPRFAGGNLYGLPAVLVEDGPWRFMLRANGAQELYDVTRDPRERHNVAFDHPELSARCRQLLEPQLTALMHTWGGDTAPVLSPRQIEALKALGYVR
jgi:arylsulfatase A-like enzyme